MASLKVISKTQHLNLYWKKPTSFLFAQNSTLLPLAAQELYQAVMHIPVAFTNTNDEFSLVAVLGLKDGTNVLVSAQGEWLGKYIPAAIRGFPFSMASDESGQQVLCIIDDFITDSPSDSAQAFFDSEGTPAQSVQDALKFLEQLNHGFKTTKKLCEILHKNNLIEPWPLQIELEGGLTEIAGLFRINEEKLTSLSAESYPELMTSGAMLIAYSQLLSMQHISAIQSAPVKNPLPDELDFDFLNESETINFSNF